MAEGNGLGGLVLPSGCGDGQSFRQIPKGHCHIVVGVNLNQFTLFRHTLTTPQ